MNTQSKRVVAAVVSIKPSRLVGHSPKFVAAKEIARRVSKSNASILLTGESGTGKEVFANDIHDNSYRSEGPFVAINCSSIPENLLESELFGHSKGSFTGAIKKRIGLFEAAEDGTLFLDEIGDLSLALQAKLLRVLQEKKIRRIGENQDKKVNCRIISATHKDLSHEMSQGRFREDLFFRLNVIPIRIPALRERSEDILLLAEVFLKRFSLENASKVRIFSREAKKFLLENRWQGNVRELENMIERAVVLCSGTEILLEDFIPRAVVDFELKGVQSQTSGGEKTFSIRHFKELPSLDEVIVKYIAYVMTINGGARDKSAKDMGIDRKTLYRRMRFEGASRLQ